MDRLGEREAGYARLRDAIEETLRALGAAVEVGNLAEVRHQRQRLAVLRAELAVWFRERRESGEPPPSGPDRGT